jgi:hypothetical protein
MISTKTIFLLNSLERKRVIKEIRTDMGTNAQMNRLLKAMWAQEKPS